MTSLRPLTGRPIDRHLPVLLAGAMGAGCCLMLPGAALSGEIRAAGGAQSLGTRINGGGSCIAGACTVTGGTSSGRHLFHRFSVFDTRGAIDSVLIRNKDVRSVIVGVTDPLGTLIDKPVSLSRPGQLYWLSPGGIRLSGAGTFLNVQQLNLSTATGLRVGTGLFDAVTSPADQAAGLDGEPGMVSTEAATLGGLGLLTNGDLSVDGGLLTVDQGLLVDAQGGHLLLNGVRLAAPGGEAVLTGANTELRGAVVDVSAPGETAGRVLVQSADTTLVAGASVLRAEGAKGGSVDVLGRTVSLSDQAAVLASGSRGGGQVRIGGDYLGGNPEVKNAWQTLVGPEAQVLANATRNGDGGRVIVWADDTTVMQGRLEARGGPEGGDGGFIETSGKRSLSIGGMAPDASAPQGRPGTWLLDPISIAVGTPELTNCSSGNPLVCTNTSGSEFLDPSILASTLSAGTSVTLISQGDISLDDNLTVVPAAAVTLLLDTSSGSGNVLLNSSIVASVGSPLNLRIASGGDIALGNAGTFPDQFNTNGGNVQLRAVNNIAFNGNLSTAGGSLTATSSSGSVAANSSTIDLNLGGGSALFGAAQAINIQSLLTTSRLSAVTANGGISLSSLAAPSGSVEIAKVGNPDSSFFPGFAGASGLEAGGANQISLTSNSPLRIDGNGVLVTAIGNGSLTSTLSAPSFSITSGASLTFKGRLLTIATSNGPPDGLLDIAGVLALADVDPSTEAGSSLRFVQGVTQQAVVRSGGRIGMGSFSSLELTRPLVLEQQGILAGDGILRSAASGTAGIIPVALTQQSGAIISPGDGDGLDSIGSLVFEGITWNVANNAVLRLDLGSAEGSSDSVFLDAIDATPAVSSMFLSGTDSPIVQLGLASPSAPPPFSPLLFTAISSADPLDTPFNFDNPNVGELIASMNGKLQLSDRVTGSLALGSLAFDYQGLSPLPGPSPSPSPAPSPAPSPSPSPAPSPAPAPAPSPSPGPSPEPTPSPAPQPTPVVNPEASIQIFNQLEQPIIPPFDTKPSLLVDQADLDPLGSSLLNVNISESDLGLLIPDADEDEPRLIVEQKLKEPSTNGRATAELTSSLDRSIAVQSVPPNNLGNLPRTSAEGGAEASLVISINDPTISQAMQVLQAAEVRRAQDINNNLSGVAPPAGAPTDLSSPALRQQLDAAVQAIRSGVGVQTP